MSTGAVRSGFDLLGGVAKREGLPRLVEALAGVEGWLGAELLEVEALLAAVSGGGAALERAAHHLLDRPGKRWRPLCLLLAARCGPRWRPEEARALAAAVELIHTATLLHDDVIDEGDERRGLPTARRRYGNSVSVLAGDWLLVEALARVQATLGGALLPALLEVLRAMSMAESVQLAHLGGPPPDPATYLAIIEGKTAGLFAWALEAGARCSEASLALTEALRAYGGALGLAFQLVDDALDLGEKPDRTGKDTAKDLREGQANHVLSLLAERDPVLLACIRQDPLGSGWREALAASGALADTRAEAARCAEVARVALAPLSPGPERLALEAIALAATWRQA